MDGEPDPPLAERLGLSSEKADRSAVPGVSSLSYDQRMSETRQPAADDLAGDGSIAVVVLTHNRAHLLRECVENVLLRTSDATHEIVIWDNASTDGTADFLDSLTDVRVRVVHSPE